MPTAAQIQDVMTKRRVTVSREYKILESHACEETGAGVFLGERKWGAKEQVALFFKPRTHNRSFRTETITSNHQRLDLLGRLNKAIEADKAAKVAPHDLKVGEILACIWGVTMQDVRFYRVCSIPSPRHVEITQIGWKMHSGDWMSGTKMPVETDQGDPSNGCEKYLVDMSSGEPRLKTRVSIERISRWSGKPVNVSSD